MHPLTSPLTTADQLVQITGTDVFASWKGTHVVLAPVRTRNGYETVDVQPVPDEGDENPFNG